MHVVIVKTQNQSLAYIRNTNPSAPVMSGVANCWQKNTTTLPSFRLESLTSPFNLWLSLVFKVEIFVHQFWP